MSGVTLEGHIYFHTGAVKDCAIFKKGFRFGSEPCETVVNGRSDDMIAPFNCIVRSYQPGDAGNFSTITLKELTEEEFASSQ